MFDVALEPNEKFIDQINDYVGGSPTPLKAFTGLIGDKQFSEFLSGLD